MAAANFSREEIKMLYAILGESDDFFRTVSKEKKNSCAWDEGELGFCGKPCVGPSCFKHMLMGLAGHKPPLLGTEDYSRVKTNASQSERRAKP